MQSQRLLLSVVVSVVQAGHLHLMWRLTPALCCAAAI
jgi:hypothetical protein